MPEPIQELLDQWRTSALSIQDLLLHLFLTLVLSQFLAWVYMRTHHGVSYSRSTVQGLIVLSLIVTMVLLAVGQSLVSAFGLFGALALIRFRTPIKDSRDTVFLFLAVGIGVAVGTHSFLVAVIGTAFTSLVMIYLHGSRFGGRTLVDGVLRLRLPAQAEPDRALRRVLGHYCRNFGVLQVREGTAADELELAFQVEFRDPEQSTGLVADVRAIPGAGDVSLLMQEQHEDL
jgi:uncharacterized membrane protein YhiD involved in acid resistance